MGIRLTLMSWWIPDYFVKRELDELSVLTTNVLRSLVEAHAPNSDHLKTHECYSLAKTNQEKRAAIAKEHVILVQALADAIGEVEAVKVARPLLFDVGLKLGRETRDLLRTGHAKPKELVKAAKVMYRILDIDVDIEWHTPEAATLFVSRCSFANKYSKLTCQILSAADEGVVSGLNPHMKMKFEHRITEGCSKCSADIVFNSAGGQSD